MKTGVGSSGIGAETAGGLRNVLGGELGTEGAGQGVKDSRHPTVNDTVRSRRWVLGILVLCSSFYADIYA